MNINKIDQQIERLQKKKQELLQKQSKTEAVETVNIGGVLYEARDNDK